MSKLNIIDLEKIKNGKLIKYNLGYENDNEKINLQKLNNQIKDLCYIRNYILNIFKNDTKNEFDRVIGERIEEHKTIDFDSRMLFLSKYLFLTIPTIFGDSACLVSKNGIESASFETSELEEKVKLIFPYIKGILKLNEESNVLSNDFYNDTSVYDHNHERQLIINGDGIFLPFRDYFEEDQDLLLYYYQNNHDILRNISIPDDEILNNYRTNVSLQKALAIYKGNK